MCFFTVIAKQVITVSHILYTAQRHKAIGSRKGRSEIQRRVYQRSNKAKQINDYCLSREHNLVHNEKSVPCSVFERIVSVSAL